MRRRKAPHPELATPEHIERGQGCARGPPRTHVLQQQPRRQHLHKQHRGAQDRQRGECYTDRRVVRPPGAHALGVAAQAEMSNIGAQEETATSPPRRWTWPLHVVDDPHLERQPPECSRGSEGADVLSLQEPEVSKANMNVDSDWVGFHGPDCRGVTSVGCAKSSSATSNGRTAESRTPPFSLDGPASTPCTSAHIRPRIVGVPQSTIPCSRTWRPSS